MMHNTTSNTELSREVVADEVIDNYQGAQDNRVIQGMNFSVGTAEIAKFLFEVCLYRDLIHNMPSIHWMEQRFSSFHVFPVTMFNQLN